MEISKWKVAGMIALAAYGMFGIIQADYAKNPNVGNALEVTGIIALIVFAVVLIVSFTKEGKRR